ncbi:zf-DHHC-domain-containing protein [Trichodelitschia bisporula]|uniref:Palmitoyltransferase n=1 Tax=Trichodelitschia bisporula TaxID=703511 RepID=A0A6G1HSE7_9PEZI|nr:zf-DHHC-domain-containing protein [Trichodelitschia bisporula]
MGLVAKVVLVVAGISFMTFVAFFGQLPAFRRTPIAFLHRLLWVYIPYYLARLDNVVTGGRLSRVFARTWNYLLYRKHPVVLIFFLGLLTGCTVMFLPAVYPYIALRHKLLLAFLIPWPYVATYVCTLANPSAPHLISPATHSAHLTYYPYDHTLYHPGVICRTCDLPKPARSKHCSLCGTCVARADHHCIWINNCVGRGNYKWFLALLASMSVNLSYAAFLAYTVLGPPVREHFARFPLDHQHSFEGREDRLGRLLGWAEGKVDVFGTAVQIGGLGIGAVGMMATMTAPLPAGLLAYHVYLIWAGMTTNESNKWSEWAEDVRDGQVWTGEMVERDASTGTEWRGHVLVRTLGEYPRWEDGIEGGWRRVTSMQEVVNIYDRGFWDNLRDALE